MRPVSSASSMRGGAVQPMSTWPLMTWVKVGGGLPVAVGFTVTPAILASAMTMTCVDEPVVE